MMVYKLKNLLQDKNVIFLIVCYSAFVANLSATDISSSKQLFCSCVAKMLEKKIFGEVYFLVKLLVWGFQLC